MAATATNYEPTKILCGPGTLWAGLAIPADDAVLTLDTGTPQAAANPSAVHLGFTRAGAVVNIVPTFEQFNADEFASPIKTRMSAVAMSIEFESLQVSDFDVMQKITAGWGTYALTGEVVSSGTVTLDSGASGSVDSITVNGVEVMSGAEAFDTSLTVTATNVAANIAANTSSPNYTATSAGAVITIKTIAASALHESTNGYAVVSTCTTIASSDVNMASGDNGDDEIRFGSGTHAFESLAFIYPTEADSSKYGVIHIYKAYCESGLAGLVINRNSLAGVSCKFSGVDITTRSADDTLGVWWEEN